MDTPYASVALDTVESTQDEAAARFAGTPVLVAADHQSKGRGRFDRTWVEPDRGLFASLAFAPEWPAEHRGLISLVAALAMRDALREAFTIEVGLRWPNDLMVGPNKVGGILVEATDERVIAGCGINLWWEDAIQGGAGLLDQDPGPQRARDVAAIWASLFLGRMAADPAYWGHHEYEAACVTVGQTVAYQRGTGTAVGIDSTGSLLIETVDGRVAVHSGEIRVATTLPDATEEPS